jgi:hypothetical protein
MGRSTGNSNLRDKRDRDIVDKFNELYNIKRLRYDYVLYLLKWNHFYVNEKHIHKTLRKMGATAPKGYIISNSIHHEGKSCLEARNAALKARFQELYDQKQMRIDDAVRVLSKEFYLNEKTVDQVLAGYNHYKEVSKQLAIEF